MADFIVYSTCIGSFVFGPNYSIRDKIIFKNIDEIRQNSKLLAEGKFIEAEKQLLKKYKASILGYKTENFKDVKVEFNQKKYFNISKVLENEIPNFYKNNLIITKNDIKLSVNKDILITQTINHLAELDKVMNMLAKRLREWYSYYLPEFSDSVQDNEKFAELIIKKNKKELLKEIRLNEQESMGAEFEKKDLEPIMTLAKQIVEINNTKIKQTEYLGKLMKEVCPNVKAIAGVSIGAKLLELAGNLEKLAEFPASTVQLLGAEKALFRHMKSGAKAPKYGVLINHPLVTKAKKEIKGKVARALADKISIAARVDYFKGKFIGDKLREGLEVRFK